MATKQKRKFLTPKTQKTFSKIIKHARNEFSRRGFLNTSIHLIASKANVSVGCIYKYFKNKDKLYRYIISNEQMNIRAYLDSYISTCSSREEKEREGLRAWLNYVKDNPGVYKLIWETLFIDKNEFDNYYNSFADSYQKALEKDNDQLTQSDYQNVAYILIGISNFLGLKIITAKNKISDAEIDKMVDTACLFMKNGMFIK